MSLANISAADLFTISSPNGKTYWNAQGQILQSAPDEMVLDHKYDPVSGLWVPRGEPVFPGRTNTLTYSQDLTVGWTRGGVLPSTAGIVPIVSGGVATLCEKTSDGASAQIRMQLHPAVANQVSVAWTILENVDATATSVACWAANGGQGGRVGVDWNGLTVSTEFAGSQGEFVSSFVADLGIGPNGGRLAFIGCATKTLITGQNVGMTLYPDLITSFGSVIVHHAQHEVGNYPGPAIFTNGSAVTRAADFLRVPLGRWYTDDEGVIFAEGETLQDNAFYLVYMQHPGSGSGGLRFDGTVTYHFALGGAVSKSQSPAGIQSRAASFSTKEFAAVGSDFAYGVDTTLTPENLRGTDLGSTTLEFGRRTGNAGESAFFGGWIRRAKWIPRKEGQQILEELVA